MEAMEMLLNRRAIRKYKDEQITKEELEKVLEAGKYAPTGQGLQSPIMVAVQNKETRDKLSKMNAAVMGIDKDPFYGAPTVVLVLADSTRMTYVEDGACVIDNMLNAAYATGLGSCWIHRCKQMFESEEGKELMKEWGIPDTYVGIGCCILGYADQNPEPKPRKENYTMIID